MRANLPHRLDAETAFTLPRVSSGRLPYTLAPLTYRPLPPSWQALLTSKPRLQATLHHLLQQWAVLEPVLLEQQEQRMLAIANSECAICLEEYSPDTPGIRTSCCGYHFHRSCLQSCLELNGHCPICSVSRGQCKVVEQRVRQH